MLRITFFEMLSVEDEYARVRVHKDSRRKRPRDLAAATPGNGLPDLSPETLASVDREPDRLGVGHDPKAVPQ